jgi:hypothetical protein
MALKDWNSRKAIYHGFYYKKKGETIYVVVEKIDKVYEVSVGDGEFFDGTIKHTTGYTKEFKTKSEALRYARDYMRKN